MKEASAAKLLRFCCLAITILLGGSCQRSKAGDENQATHRQSPGENLSIRLSSFLGGVQEDTIRDVTTDRQGNIYLTGGTASPNFPVTAGAYSRDFNGLHDVFVAKLDPNGKIVWSTFIGGPKYDRAYAVEVDSRGYVYIAGRAGSGFPVTEGAFQTVFQGGGETGIYGPQDGFLLKLTPDGSNISWASYFGTSDDQAIRDIDVDQLGDVYIATAHSSGTYPSNVARAFQHGFQKSNRGGQDGVIAKIRSDGSQVLWATYLGGAGKEAGESSIRLDAAGNVYYLTLTNSSDMPTTATAYDRTLNGGGDFYLAKLNQQGKLIYGTYLGGSENEHVETHELTVDRQGNAYIAAGTKSRDFPTTTNALQRQYGGSGGRNTGSRTNYSGDIVVAKISSDGSTLLASTFIGGRFGEAAEGVAVDTIGNVYLSGATYSDDFPMTRNAFQSSPKSSGDVFAIVLSSDLASLLYSTYLGGASTDYGRSAYIDSQRSFYIVGMTQSKDWPVVNAFQRSLGGSWDGMLVKFAFPVANAKAR